MFVVIAPENRLSRSFRLGLSIRNKLGCSIKKPGRGDPLLSQPGNVGLTSTLLGFYGIMRYTSPWRQIGVESSAMLGQASHKIEIPAGQGQANLGSKENLWCSK
ncbi:hypothetical protein M569_00020 [Genlisea aurea]|uniref:Uncharacterized protein n=1 Tax=Genlisea aurea TaxID=192259 RepID=S8D5P9_9LAMI|nr:hypothetical protein M569_00020 [Genlisea aurea]